MTRTQPVLCPAPHRDDTPRRAADGLILCLWHRDRLERHLAELPALHQACEATLLGRGGTNGAGPVSGTTEPSWAVSDASSAARQHIVLVLEDWCRIVMTERGLAKPPATLTGRAAYLVISVDWLSASRYAAEITDSVATAHSEAWNAAYPNPAKRVRLGHCPMPGCEGDLTAIVREHDQLLPASIRCDATRDNDEPHTWEPDQWSALRRRMIRTPAPLERPGA